MFIFCALNLTWFVVLFHRRGANAASTRINLLFDILLEKRLKVKYYYCSANLKNCILKAVFLIDQIENLEMNSG